jgi:DNA-binding HxlR family transcriptional regulator
MPTLLSDLKGCQLSILVALLRAAGRPMSNRELAEETGYGDDKTVAHALRRLSQRMLVVKLGNPNHRNEWALTVTCRQFLLPGQALLTESRENPDSPPYVVVVNTSSDSEREDLQQQHQSRENPDSLRAARLAAALREAGVWPVTALNLACKLEAGIIPLTWLDVLGWVAYARDRANGLDNPGAVLRANLLAGEAPPDAWKPPHDDFDQALEWALMDPEARKWLE